MSPARRKQEAFQPVIMFTDYSPADEAAVRQIYSLHNDVRETMNTERSKQQTIGISEIGMDCRKCVARKLSGLYVKVADPSWKAQVGTFIHAGLEDHFGTKYYDRNGKYPKMSAEHEPDFLPGGLVAQQATDTHPFYVPERRLQILKYGSLDLGGSCDLFVQGASFGIVDDWKTQGSEKLRLKTGKGDIGQQYTVQMHTYGLGYEMLGYHVTHVLLYALPRDGELDAAKPVLARYDRDIALEALTKLQTMIDVAEIVGWEKLIAVTPRASWCWECDRYDSQDDDSFVRSIVGG